MDRLGRLRPRTVLISLALTFAAGTIFMLVSVQPERAIALKTGLVLLGSGVFMFGWAKLSDRILAGRSEVMTEWSREYYESIAEFGPVVATAMVPCGLLLLLSAPLLS